jgi:chromosome transmission fidelity protein 18
MSDYPAGFPSSFDPALLQSETDFLLNDAAPPSVSHSDEIDAIAQCIAEDRAEKTRRGIVIQYRSWNTQEAFRSEELHSIGTADSLACAVVVSGSDKSRYPNQVPQTGR